MVRGRVERVVPSVDTAPWEMMLTFTRTKFLLCLSIFSLFHDAWKADVPAQLGLTLGQTELRLALTLLNRTRPQMVVGSAGLVFPAHPPCPHRLLANTTITMTSSTLTVVASALQQRSRRQRSIKTVPRTVSTSSTLSPWALKTPHLTLAGLPRSMA